MSDPLSQPLLLNRQTLYLRPDPARVVARPFKPAIEPRDLNPTDKTRANHILDRVLGLEPAAVTAIEGRARKLRWSSQEPARHFRGACGRDGRSVGAACHIVENAALPVGAYFLHEYSFEASALFNPSIVRHPDQSGAPDGGCRFILSLRAAGEGHISSLTFRSGSIAADGSVAIDPTARLASVPKITTRTSRPNGDMSK